MGKMNEIFVAIKETDYIEAQIGGLCEKYNNRCGVDYVQQRALFRSYCYDTIKLFEDCFETSMLGIQHCILKVKGYQTKDDLDIRRAIFDIVDMLCELKDIVRTMVPIKDLPSCKRLTELYFRIDATIYRLYDERGDGQVRLWSPLVPRPTVTIPVAGFTIFSIKTTAIGRH